MFRRGAVIVTIWLSLATLAWGAVVVAIVAEAPLQVAAFVGACAFVAWAIHRVQSAGIFNRDAGGNRNAR